MNNVTKYLNSIALDKNYKSSLQEIRRHKLFAEINQIQLSNDYKPVSQLTTLFERKDWYKPYTQPNDKLSNYRLAAFLENLDLDALIWLKEEFSDISSDGDVINNEVLDMLIQYNEYKISYNELKQYMDRKIKYHYHIVAYLYYAFFDSFMEGKKPNPFWWT
jgi:hypothetical protein